MKIEEALELIKKSDNDKLNQKLNEDPSISDLKTEQGISLLQFAAYCRNNAAVDISCHLRTYFGKVDAIG